MEIISRIIKCFQKSSKKDSVIMLFSPKLILELCIKRYLQENEKKDNDFKKIIKDYVRQSLPLSYAAGRDLGRILIQALKDKDYFKEVRCGVLLTGLHTKSVWDHPMAHLQLAGITAAVMKYDIPTTEYGFVNVSTPSGYVIDNCGMGGDAIVTANVSTLAALIASCDGIPMLKHGSPASTDTGRHGSSNFLDIRGISTHMSPKEITKHMNDSNFAYIEAFDSRYKRIHRSSSESLALPHMNGIIGPMTVPVNPHQLQKKLMGTNSLISPLLIAKTYQVLNKENITNLNHGIFFRGIVTVDGVKHYVDEISLEDNEVVELKNGEITQYSLSYKDFGIDRLYEDISPALGSTKAQFSEDIIYGRHTGGGYHMVLCNTALLYHIHEGVSLKDGYQKAKAILDSDKLIPHIIKLQKTNYTP